VEYPRLRFGIGADYPKGRQIDFVLSRWDDEEMPVVKKKTTIAAEVIETFAIRGLAVAMNDVNKMEITA